MHKNGLSVEFSSVLLVQLFVSLKLVWNIFYCAFGVDIYTSKYILKLYWRTFYLGLCVGAAISLTLRSFDSESAIGTWNFFDFFRLFFHLCVNPESFLARLRYWIQCGSVYLAQFWLLFDISFKFDCVSNLTRISSNLFPNIFFTLFPVFLLKIKPNLLRHIDLGRLVCGDFLFRFAKRYFVASKLVFAPNREEIEPAHLRMSLTTLGEVHRPVSRLSIVAVAAIPG